MKHIRGVVSLKLDTEKCIGCGRCVEVCPHRVFVMDAMNNKKAKIADSNSCMECGACAKNCPVDAITVKPDMGCAMGFIMRFFGKKGDCC